MRAKLNEGREGGGGSAGANPAASRLPLRRRIVWATVTLICFGVIGFLLIEIGLRLFVPVTDIPYYFWDPVVGIRRGPNQTGRYIVDPNINAGYRFNARGWNHPGEYSVARPAGGRRICLVGDSYVEALQVELDETMFAVAERRMNRAERPVEWYAFGCSGFGVSQNLEVIRHYALDYRPDVVIMFFVSNDVEDCSAYLGPIEEYVVTHYLDEQDELVLLPPRPWAPSRLRRTAGNLALARYLALQRGLRPAPPRPVAANQPRREVTATTTSHVLPGADLQAMSWEQRQETTWLLVEKLLVAARDECRRRGALFVVADRGSSARIESALAGVEYSLPPRDEDPFCLGPRAQEMGSEWVGPIAARLGIPFLDMTEPLREEVARTGQTHRFPNDGHYNEMAHETVGRVLAEWVESLLEYETASVATGERTGS